MLHTVIFDLDGTLLDTSSGFICATERIVRLYGLAPIPKQEICSFIGPPIQDSFAAYYKLTTEQAGRLGSTWRDVYKNEFLLDAQPYDGIYDVLKFCRMNSIKTCVATNKREDYAMLLLDHFGFLPILDCVCGSDFEGKRKKSDSIRVCMEKTIVTKSDKCLMIGDTVGDLVAAEQVGIDFAGVTYGFGFKPGEMYNDPRIVHMADRAADLKSLICESSFRLAVSEDPV